MFAKWVTIASFTGGDKGVKGLSLLSQGRPTKQDSVGWGGQPSRAVDGFTNGQWGRGTSSHTARNKNSWWEVDLQSSYPVYLVVIHNRWDCCQNRIDGAVVKVDKEVCGTVKYKKGVSVYPISCGGVKGSVVRIEQPKNYLTLAEVQVFGTGGPDPVGGTIGSGDYSMLLSENHFSTQSHGNTPMRAVDGNTDGHWGHNSIAYTGQARNNWWKVDLYDKYNVNMVVIYNRRGSEQRINGLQVIF